MALLYVDASALVKLVRDEPESGSLRALLAGAELVSSGLVLVEIPRAVRRAAAYDPDLPLPALIGHVGELLDAVALAPVDHGVLATAGAIDEPALGSLDAIHVVTAASLAPIDAFVGYDERQSAAARLAGLRTVAPS